jgi:hypothetical protein
MSTKPVSVPKKTCIGRKNIGTSTMNKSRRRSFKKYRGQGK